MQRCGGGWARRRWPRRSDTPGAWSRPGSSRSIKRRGRRGAPRAKRRLSRVFTTRFQAWVRRNALRLARLLARSPLTPNQITTVGMALTFVAAALAGFSQLLPAGLVLAFAGTFDILDGALARASKRSYPYGAFLDSTIDRYSECAVYIGIAAYFLTQGGVWMRLEAVGCMVALAGSFMVSYVRARAPY